MQCAAYNTKYSLNVANGQAVFQYDDEDDDEDDVKIEKRIDTDTSGHVVPWS